MVAKDPSRTHLAWPKGKYENYTISAKARWTNATSKGKKYGLTFSIVENANEISSFYTFMVYPDTQEYEVKYYNRALTIAWRTIYSGQSTAILTNTNTNHLWLGKISDTVSLTVNNVLLAQGINANQISGKRRVGIGVGPYTRPPNSPPAEARFDDYLICPPDTKDASFLDLTVSESEIDLKGGTVPGG
jgi:hypothetical protein